jgi:hypothetical protein
VFRPATSLASAKHTIEADVFQNGRPRAQLKVLRYTVVVLARPGSVSHPSARRTPSG